MSDSDEDGGIPLIEPMFDSDVDSKKRKRGGEADATSESKKARKKARRKENKKQKAKAINNDDLDQELGVNHAFERMDSQLLADYINSRTRLYGTDLSSVELEDRFIPSRSIQDASAWDKPRTLNNLAAFLKSRDPELKPTPSKPCGAPHTLVITASGIRAADVFRSLRSGLPTQGVKNPSVAKLFAKHMKLAEQVGHLNKSKIDFGVGTPERLSALLEQKALSTANLKRIVVDVSYIDQKKRGILDMKELQEPLIQLLVRQELRSVDNVDEGGLLVFY
ncbi:hypothetical protein BU24DRAFT_404601 [Aaosphaeria arxii CBS 175.79]|uniref:U3-containing 90S pre-ribosomal complex subunit-domain containing protein n=1 Tax=Aaosphaeria arxii CBS 175.79 TaxID=1450172 RepID=A0A6A5Y9V9_9PLEO|nr:uncharacterized protein BU24DRAFT_404601 [Aaosphaeria arxii CBS 175.79]KAF2021600.1 hypothetical protein BU24DRAFT_404601 [Aaosphaeria arxii CBS 175.79]